MGATIEAEDILEAVKPLLASYKAVLLLSDELIQIGERYYIKAVATFADTESPEHLTGRGTDKKGYGQ